MTTWPPVIAPFFSSNLGAPRTLFGLNFYTDLPIRSRRYPKCLKVLGWGQRKSSWRLEPMFASDRPFSKA
ncbi:hypothetical protein CMV_029928 [Castanea mollissima]|uniref:Uncharacterized protein n=1 Tax=Castanea mollissima TaxID=60419 RepID=A0A8J4V6X2_9ROSI|nr:hypothetical protein CMV_029928 [Castanea mollissima]